MNGDFEMNYPLDMLHKDKENFDKAIEKAKESFKNKTKYTITHLNSKKIPPTQEQCRLNAIEVVKRLIGE